MSSAGLSPASSTVSTPPTASYAPVPPVIACSNGTFSSWSEVTMPWAVIWPPGSDVVLKHCAANFGSSTRTTVHSMSLVPTRLSPR